MLPRGGDTAEVCIIRVPVRRGYAFAVNDFVGRRALVQGKPQPQRKDLPVWVEGRDNVYSFGHADHLIFIIQTYVRKINRKNSDLAKINGDNASFISQQPEQAVKAWFLTLANGFAIRQISHATGRCLAIAYKYSDTYGAVMAYGFGFPNGPVVYTCSGTWVE